MYPKTVPFESHSLTAAELAQMAASTGTYSLDPKTLAKPLQSDGGTLLVLERASSRSTVGALVLWARALRPQSTESVWKSLVLSRAALLGLPFFRKSIAYSPRSLA